MRYEQKSIIGTAAAERAGHTVTGDGRGRTGIGVAYGSVGVGMAAGGAGDALGQVVAGLRGGAGAREFRTGVEAGQRLLGNRAFLQWVRALGAAGRAGAVAARDVCAPGRRNAAVPAADRAPLQMMGRKKKKQGAGSGAGHACAGKTGGGGAGAEGKGVPEPEAGHACAGKTGDDGAGAEGKALPGPVAARPEASGTLPNSGKTSSQAGTQEAGAPVERGRRRPRVQVALNTLRAEGVAAFGAYLEANICERELLRTLVGRIMRAEDLAGVRAAALVVVEGRLDALEPDAGAGIRQASRSARSQDVEIAVAAPVKPDLGPRETRLFDCCVRGDIGKLRQLLRDGHVDINVQSKAGSLLFVAALKGRAGVVSELLSRPDIDVNQANLRTSTPLFIAAQEGRTEVVRLLLAARGIDVNLATLNRCTPLYIAAQKGHVENVKLLLAAPGINVNGATKFGAPPLIIAAQHRHKEVVRLLLGAPGVDIDMQKNDGGTALIMAAQCGFPEIVELLVRRGADVNLDLNTGTTALCIAADRGCLEVVRILLQVPTTDIDKATDIGATALLAATQMRHKDVVRILLRKGADPNLAMNSGATPLHTACLSGCTGLVEMLLQAGADLDAKVEEGPGFTPPGLARLAGHQSIISLLERHRQAQTAPVSEAGVLPPHLRQAPEDEPGRTSPSPAAPETVQVPLAAQAGQTCLTTPAGAESRESMEEEATDGATANVTPESSGQAEAVSELPAAPASPLAQAQDALRQEVLGKLDAANLDMLAGIRLLQAVNAAESIDTLCVLYNRLAHIERQEERARRQGLGRQVLPAAIEPDPAPPPAPGYALGGKTGLDAEAVEGEIKRHLDRKYHRFVGQAVNGMEFGRGKGTAGYPGLWHSSAGVAGVGSCSVFYYLEGSGQKLRIVGIGHHVGRAAYRLDYATGELGGPGRILRIA